MAAKNSTARLTGAPSSGPDDGAVKIVPAELRNGHIAFAGPDEQFGEMLEGRSLVIFRGVFAAEEMLELRRQVRSWGDATPAFPSDRSAGVPGLNFHRIDDASHPTTLPHVFHQYGFATLADIPSRLQMALRRVGEPLVELQNRLAGTDLSLGPEGLRIKVIRHPCGGGLIAPHRHPYLPQKVSVFLNISVAGVDYHDGEARFRLGGRWFSTREAFLCGDVLAWRYDVIHDVPPVDADRPLSWESDDGFWILAPELVESHGRSKVTGKGASAPR